MCGGPKISQRSQGQPQPLNREYCTWSVGPYLSPTYCPFRVTILAVKLLLQCSTANKLLQLWFSPSNCLGIQAFEHLFASSIRGKYLKACPYTWTVTHNVGSQALVKLTVFFIPGFPAFWREIDQNRQGKVHYKGNNRNKEFYKRKS